MDCLFPRFPIFRQVAGNGGAKFEVPQFPAFWAVGFLGSRFPDIGAENKLRERKSRRRVTFGGRYWRAGGSVSWRAPNALFLGNDAGRQRETFAKVGKIPYFFKSYATRARRALIFSARIALLRRAR